MTNNGNPYIELMKQCLMGSIYRQNSWLLLTPGKRGWIREWFIRKLAARSYGLVKFIPEVDQEDTGKTWPFLGYTMIGRKRLDNIEQCVNDVITKGVPGDLIETGVWRGGSTIFMRALLKQHSVKDRFGWVADSFEGLPKPNTDKYGEKAGDDLSMEPVLKVSLEDVQRNFARFGLLDDQVKFLKGWFSQTLPKAPINKLSVLRLDGDLYESTIDVLKSLYDRVSPGGYVIVDDYYSWESCKAAVQDFRQERGIKAEIQPIDWTGCFWQVPPNQ